MAVAGVFIHYVAINKVALIKLHVSLDKVVQARITA
jgi:hypothetical protein